MESTNKYTVVKVNNITYVCVCACIHVTERHFLDVALLEIGGEAGQIAAT